MKSGGLKADLHVHSRSSTRPSEWILRKIGCAESYTYPLELYRLAKERGMNLVTVTDHNTLAGSLEIAHLPDTFLSEEVTTYFPEDGCKLHVLVYNITEAQHEDISRLRENVFDLAAYLNREGIVHALAHPLYAVNEKLAVEHVEKALILFGIFELNGTRDGYQNETLRAILTSLRKEDMEMLCEKHNLVPLATRPWKKGIVGGSDDHSSLTVASTCTEVEGASSISDFLQGVAQGRALVKGGASNPKVMARNLYSIAYQFYRNRFGLERYVSRELLLRFIDRALVPGSGEAEGLVDRIRRAIVYRRSSAFFRSRPKTFRDLFEYEAREIILRDQGMSALVSSHGPVTPGTEKVWFRFVNQIADGVMKQLANSVLNGLSGANLFDIFHTVGSAGSLYTMLAPYLVSYTLFKKDRRFCDQCRRHFLFNREEAPPNRILRVAHFTDTFHEVNGVALTLKKELEISMKHELHHEILTCGPEPDAPGVANFRPIGTYELPEYPDLKLCYPPLLKMLDYCYE
ncbi:MAG: glycosyl transferase, partial [Deltaproteobacteria bacterium]|nr:glycosyl transferase [Deltaproteobacteria bacterium]